MCGNDMESNTSMDSGVKKICYELPEDIFRFSVIFWIFSWYHMWKLMKKWKSCAFHYGEKIKSFGPRRCCRLWAKYLPDFTSDCRFRFRMILRYFLSSHLWNLDENWKCYLVPDVLYYCLDMMGTFCEEWKWSGMGCFELNWFLLFFCMNSIYCIRKRIIDDRGMVMSMIILLLFLPELVYGLPDLVNGYPTYLCAFMNWKNMVMWNFKWIVIDGANVSWSCHILWANSPQPARVVCDKVISRFYGWKYELLYFTGLLWYCSISEIWIWNQDICFYKSLVFYLCCASIMVLFIGLSMMIMVLLSKCRLITTSANHCCVKGTLTDVSTISANRYLRLFRNWFLKFHLQ